MNNNFVYNKNCPICKSDKIINKKKIKSKHIEINLIFNLKYCKNCGHKFLSSFPKENYLARRSHIPCVQQSVNC